MSSIAPSRRRSKQTLAYARAGREKRATGSRRLLRCHLEQPCRRNPSRCQPDAPTGQPELQPAYGRNQQYSITAVTGTTGTIQERYAYTAYGEPTILDAAGTTVLASSAYGNRIMYTGREWDAELALYHYRARMYDPVSGRFVSRDPTGYEGSPWNLYGYTSDNPVRRLDPNGTDWLDCMVACMDDALITNQIAAGATAAVGVGGISVKKKLPLGGRKRTSILTRIGIRTGWWSYPTASTASKVCGRAFLVLGVADAAVEVVCAGRCARNPNW